MVGNVLRSCLNVMVCMPEQQGLESEYVPSGLRNLFSRIDRNISWNWLPCSPECDEFLQYLEGGQNESGAADSSPRPVLDNRIDLVLIIGLFEWPDQIRERIFRFVEHIAKPLMLFVSGPIGGKFEFKDGELSVLKKAIIITNDQESIQFLTKNNLTGMMFPCPALFASNAEFPARKLETIGIDVFGNLSLDSVSASGASRSLMNLLKELKNLYRIDLLCHEMRAYLEVPQMENVTVQFCGDQETYKRMMGECDAIVSASPKAAMFVNSLLKPSILMDDNTNKDGEIEIFPFVHHLQNGMVADFLQTLDLEMEVRALFNWKREQESAYLKMLRDNLKKHAVH